MYRAQNKTISWVILTAFTLHLIPLPLYAREWNWSDFRVGIGNGTTSGGGSGSNAGVGSGNSYGSSSVSGSGSGSSSGSGSATSSGISSGSGSGVSSGLGSGSNGGGTSGGNGGGGLNPPPRTNEEIKPLWIPLCFFFDPKYSSAEGQQTVKTVVDKFAACGIAVKPHAFTLRAGTFSPDDPDNLNANARFHCQWKGRYPDAKYGVAQTHPDSIKASDYMCDGKGSQEIKDKEEGKKPWTVGGCAEQASDVSIVDRGGKGGVATHEFGHNVAQNSKLENYGEGGVFKTNAGLGLQLVDSPRDINKTGPIATEGHDHEGLDGDGFTAPGCAALRSGANDNSNRKISYNPKALKSYYERMKDPNNQIDYNGRGKAALPPIPYVEKGPSNGDNGSELVGSDRQSPGRIKNLSGNPISYGERIKPKESKSATGGHPELKQEGFSSKGNRPSTEEGGSGSESQTVIAEGKGDPIQDATTQNYSSNEQKSDTFFKNLDGKSAVTGETKLAGATGTTSGASKATAGAGAGKAAGDVNVISLRNNTESQSKQSSENAVASRENASIGEETNPNFWSDLNKPKSKDKPAIDSVAKKPAGNNALRARLLDPVATPSKTTARAFSSVPANEIATKTVPVQTEQRGFQTGRRVLQQSFSASSDPGLSRNLRETRQPVGDGRVPGAGRTSVGRESRTSIDSVYGESSSSAGE